MNTLIGKIIGGVVLLLLGLFFINKLIPEDKSAKPVLKDSKQLEKEVIKKDEVPNITIIDDIPTIPIFINGVQSDEQRPDESTGITSENYQVIDRYRQETEPKYQGFERESEENNTDFTQALMCDDVMTSDCETYPECCEVQ